MRRRDLIAMFVGAAAWPLVLRAQQQPIMPVIGFLHYGSPGSDVNRVTEFRRGLSEIGYVEGQNVAIEYRWAEGHYDRLPALAADLISRKVNVIAAVSSPSALAAKGASSSIPIVFTSGTDPVADGLVASLARPGGNVTGVSFLFADLNSKRLDLLSELIPRAKVVALLVNPKMSQTERVIRDAAETVRLRGMQLVVLKAGTDSEIDAAFAALDHTHVDALVVGGDPFFDSRREQLVALASRHAVPAIYPWRVFADAGGLISYGPNLTAVYRELGICAGKVLKGARPADLPVLQPTTFELVINIKTAKVLGLTVPSSILGRADEVIE